MSRFMFSGLGVGRTWDTLSVPLIFVSKLTGHFGGSFFVFWDTCFGVKLA